MIGESWIDDLVHDCEHVETPTSWLWWSFLTCISAAACNNYYLNALKKDLVYRPNLYVILLGESGLGKAFPINRAAALIQKADLTRVVKGRSSIQAIIKELATTRQKEGKPLIADSRGFIVNGELSTAIIKDPDSLTILTDLYDTHEEWTNMLKGDGSEKLKNNYITCLFGSSPAHFYESIPQANIEGGYIGRNLVVYEEKRSKDVDLLDEASDEFGIKFDEITAPKYIPHLTKIGTHNGVMVPSEGARQAFNTWRREWRATQAKYNDKTGFINRVPDHVLKVAMCISLSRYNGNCTIDEMDMLDSISKVTSLVYSNEKAVGGVGLDPLASQTKRVVDYLLSAAENQLTRRQLLTKGYGHYDAVVLDRILETLLEMGWVKRKKTLDNKDWILMLSGEPLDSYLKYKEARRK